MFVEISELYDLYLNMLLHVVIDLKHEKDPCVVLFHQKTIHTLADSFYELRMKMLSAADEEADNGK